MPRWCDFRVSLPRPGIGSPLNRCLYYIVHYIYQRGGGGAISPHAAAYWWTTHLTDGTMCKRAADFIWKQLTTTLRSMEYILVRMCCSGRNEHPTAEHLSAWWALLGNFERNFYSYRPVDWAGQSQRRLVRASTMPTAQRDLPPTPLNNLAHLGNSAMNSWA